MKLSKSIRWRLQVWYGVILVAVLAGFGFTAWQLQRAEQFRKVDDQLRRRAASLMRAFRPPRPMGSPPRGPEMDFRPPPDAPPSEPDLAADPGAPRHFRLPPDTTNFFSETGPGAFYYVVWDRDGKELARTTNAPAGVQRPAHAGPEPEAPQLRGIYRETSIVTRPGDAIVVGRSVVEELNDLTRLAWRLAGFGGAILLLGLAGGWRLVTSSMRPISQISGAAEKIAAGDLKQRIDVRDAETELGALATVLNSTFARLDAAFDRQKNFTADAAHELRTPVSVILTQTQGSLARERKPAEYREALESCERAAQRMRRLTESLLELARLDAGQSLNAAKPFDFSACVRECVEMVRPMAREAQVDLVCHCPPVKCLGDSNRIAQVVVNLLTNAIQYNKQLGRVHIATELQNGMAILTVTDTGAGISEKDLTRIFDRFYRADKARSSGHSGLGLAISKAIVEAHHGKIHVSSQLNTGSTFTVYLPSPD
jgi:heavy metal sensor kinase